MAIRPKVGGFPYLAEALWRAGVTRNVWSLPSCQSLFLTTKGPVGQHRAPCWSRGPRTSPLSTAKTSSGRCALIRPGRALFPNSWPGHGVRVLFGMTSISRREPLRITVATERNTRRLIRRLISSKLALKDRREAFHDARDFRQLSLDFRSPPEEQAVLLRLASTTMNESSRQNRRALRNPPVQLRRQRTPTIDFSRSPTYQGALTVKIRSLPRANSTHSRSRAR